MARAPRSRAKSPAAAASARLMPRRRKPARVTKQVTAQTPVVGLVCRPRPSLSEQSARNPRVATPHRADHAELQALRCSGVAVHGKRSVAGDADGAPDRRTNRPITQ